MLGHQGDVGNESHPPIFSCHNMIIPNELLPDPLFIWKVETLFKLAYKVRMQWGEESEQYRFYSDLARGTIPELQHRWENRQRQMHGAKLV